MHELAITQSMIDLIDREAKDKGFQKVLAIRLRVGEYSGLVPECLLEFFPIAAKGSIAEGAELKAPEGKFICMTVDGVGCDPKPGR